MRHSARRGAVAPSPHVRIDDLVPVQHRANRSFRIAADVRVQRMLKHPQISEFHSHAEHLYAGLLEGNPVVTAYVPQPFALHVGKRRYKPDFYVVDGNQRRVIELKPRGEFNPALWGPLEAFFATQGMRFEVISNESVIARIGEAQNWLEIVRALYLNRDLDTQAAEAQLLVWFEAGNTIPFSEFVDPGDRDGTLEQEIAVLRLLHMGRLTADLEDAPLDYSTEIRLP